MSLQAGKQAAIDGVKKAFERAAKMDGRSPEDITDELATDIINAVITLIMSGDVATIVKSAMDSQVIVGNGSGKIS